jgi:hypothetical protein
MKKGFLPLGFLTLLISGVAVFFFISATNDDASIKGNNGQGIVKAKEWLAMVRNNQNTGLLDPRDVIKARNQTNEASIKSANEGLDWVEMGPTNMGGRTRALIVDNRDASANTLYAASVNGGIFKTTNLGAIWEKVNTSNGTGRLNVSCMIQSSDGTIYVGTGEAFNNPNYTGLGEMGFASGFVGQGIFKSDASDNFTRVEGTEPAENDEAVEWAFISEIAMSANGNLWAATNTGLMVKTGSGWMYAQYTDTSGVVQDLTGFACDVEAHPDGLVVAGVDGLGYISVDGSSNGFIGFSMGEEDNLPAEDISRLQLAIAPSDQNIIYAMTSKASENNSLENVYLSEDRGQTWSVIGPGGSETLNILGEQGDYTNVLEVYPNDPYHILAGGINIWESWKVSDDGFYSWGERSTSNSLIPEGILNSKYVHADHHVYAFRPGTNEFFIGTDGGIYKGTIGADLFIFQVLNKNYNVTQFYTLDVSNKLNEVLAGSQDNGTIHIGGAGETNLPLAGGDLWNYGSDEGELFPEGSDGGYCAFSTIRKYESFAGVTIPPIFYSKSPLQNSSSLGNRMRRSETMAFDYSLSFLDDEMDDDSFLTPMVLWENFTNDKSRDSVDFIADKDYLANESVVVRSATLNHPFDYTLPGNLNKGDTLRVKDIVSTRMFVATEENIYMTKDALDFKEDSLKWFLISNKDNSNLLGIPQCIAYSANANYLYVGTQEGKLYRISNLALAYDYNRADVRSSNCIVATDLIEFVEGGNNQVITSISVDPLDANKVLITLGNYGNTDYIFYSENATSDDPQFISVQGDLPAMPVYASVLDMDEGDKAIIGTDNGIWVTEDVSTGNWVQDNSGMGNIPVMMLKQQQVYKGAFTITTHDTVTNQTTYESFEGIENYGVIYAATYGRGIFRGGDVVIGIPDRNEIVGTQTTTISVYPNPVINSANLKIHLYEASNVQIQIFDITGKIVKSLIENNLQKGENSIRINVSGLNKGTYIVKMTAGKTAGTSKFVIVK